MVMTNQVCLKLALGAILAVGCLLVAGYLS